MSHVNLDAINPFHILILIAVPLITLKLPAVLRYLRIWFTIRKLPTPAGGSLISGHMGLFTPLAKHKFEEKNSKALGPIYRQRYYTRQTVVIADPALAQEIWAAERDGAIEKPDQPNGFHKGKGKSEMNVFNEKSADPMWKLVRKGTAPAFAPQNLRNYHHHIVDILDRLSSGIKQKGGRTPVDIADIAQRESFDVIGKVGFGQDFQASKDIDNPVNTFRLMTDNMEEGIRRIFYPFRKYSRSKDKLEADEKHKKMRKIYRDLVDQCLNRPPSDEDANSIAGHLLRLRDAKGQPLSKARLIEEFAVFFIAGSETTGHTVAWTLYFLAKNPAAMAKVEAELEAAGLLKTAANPTPRPFTYADIGKLHYLDCCIKESMRLQPVAANSLRRLVVRDIQLSNGVTLPAGVAIEMAQYSIFRNPAFGWKDPMSFAPERWEDPEEDYFKPKEAPRVHRSSNGDDLEVDAGDRSADKVKRMHPFGQGIRNCLGQQLAKINIPTAVAMLLREFHMELAPETANKDISQLEVVKVTLQPKDGIMMLCKPRA